MGSAESNLPDSELAAQVARLWPHRQHESNAFAGLLCRAGLHRWRRLELSTLVHDRDIVHCFWCAKVRIDGTTYDP